MYKQGSNRLFTAW